MPVNVLKYVLKDRVDCGPQNQKCDFIPFKLWKMSKVTLICKERTIFIKHLNANFDPNDMHLLDKPFEYV